MHQALEPSWSVIARRVVVLHVCRAGCAAVIGAAGSTCNAGPRVWHGVAAGPAGRAVLCRRNTCAPSERADYVYRCPAFVVRESRRIVAKTNHLRVHIFQLLVIVPLIPNKDSQGAAPHHLLGGQTSGSDLDALVFASGGTRTHTQPFRLVQCILPGSVQHSTHASQRNAAPPARARVLDSVCLAASPATGGSCLRKNP